MNLNFWNILGDRKRIRQAKSAWEESIRVELTVTFQNYNDKT